MHRDIHRPLLVEKKPKFWAWNWRRETDKSRQQELVFLIVQVLLPREIVLLLEERRGSADHERVSRISSDSHRLFPDNSILILRLQVGVLLMDMHSRLLPLVWREKRCARSEQERKHWRRNSESSDCGTGRRDDDKEARESSLWEERERERERCSSFSSVAWTRRCGKRYTRDSQCALAATPLQILSSTIMCSARSSSHCGGGAATTRRSRASLVASWCPCRSSKRFKKRPSRGSSLLLLLLPPQDEDNKIGHPRPPCYAAGHAHRLSIRPSDSVLSADPLRIEQSKGHATKSSSAPCCKRSFPSDCASAALLWL